MLIMEQDIPTINPHHFWLRISYSTFREQAYENKTKIKYLHFQSLYGLIHGDHDGLLCLGECYIKIIAHAYSLNSKKVMALIKFHESNGAP